MFSSGKIAIATSLPSDDLFMIAADETPTKPSFESTINFYVVPPLHTRQSHQREPGWHVMMQSNTLSSLIESSSLTSSLSSLMVQSKRQKSHKKIFFFLLSRRPVRFPPGPSAEPISMRCSKVHETRCGAIHSAGSARVLLALVDAHRGFPEHARVGSVGLKQSQGKIA